LADGIAAFVKWYKNFYNKGAIKWKE
jgi:hypothetical protein